MSNEEIIAQLCAENQQLRSRLAACEAMLRSRPRPEMHMVPDRTSDYPRFEEEPRNPGHAIWDKRVDALLAEGGKGGGGNG